jgi:hypothetical protein
MLFLCPEVMMKSLLGLFMFFTASMSSPPEKFVSYYECSPESGPSCVVETTFVCPPGYIDGCITNKTPTHQCLPSGNAPSCELSMDINCPLNFEDGCLSGDTEEHLCIPIRGKTCSSSKNFICPSGFVDFCIQ